jgi:type I restriction enzyme S subunit
MELPKGWKLLSFSEAFKDRTGGQQKIKKNDYLASGNLPIIDQGQQFVAGFTNNLNFQCNIELPCILFGDHTKKFKFVEKPFALGADGVKVLETNKNIDTKFAFHYLQTLYLPDVGYSRHFRFLKRTVIPVPPIASQRRIANILDKADEIVRKRKEAIALTEQLQKSIFLDMFGDPVINPKGWEVNKVIDYCDCIVPGRDKPKSFTGSIPWITTADLKFLDKTYFSNLNMKLSENEIKEVNAKIIPKNSVLLTCVGDLGVTSIAGCDMVVNQQLHSFQCKNINNYFLMYALPYQKIFMYKRATQTTVPYMNKNTCNSIPIIYPPRKLQEKFGILIAEINNKKGLYLKALQESENLFNSLLQKAFKGEL